MAGKDNTRAEELNLCCEKLMMTAGVSSGVSDGQVNMEEGVINEWKDIPMQLLLRIMSLVDDRTIIVASGVCCGWRDAIGLGLTHLSLVWLKKNMNNLVLSLAPKFTKLQSLVLRQDKPQLEDNAVEAIATYCRDLQHLDLSKSFKLTDCSLYALAHGCPNLTKLNISGCSAFSDIALAYLTGFCRKLKILNLCGCVKAATDHALQAIARNCNQLLAINLGLCERVSDIGVVSLSNDCPDLRVLELSGCIFITDYSVYPLAYKCPHLLFLGLSYCRNITDRAMYALVRRMKKKPASWEPNKGGDDNEGLKVLYICECTALTPPAVQAVLDAFPALRTRLGVHPSFQVVV